MDYYEEEELNRVKLHETQKQQMRSNEVTLENEPIANLQYIEGGGPPKRVI
ncbi:hypothetical protein D3C71_1203190 [compost metagenome]